MEKAVEAVETVIINGSVALFPVACTFPIIRMIYSSLKTDQELSLDILSLPRKLISDNYVQAAKEGSIGSYFMNSMSSILIAVAVVIVIAFVTGYCLSRFRFRGGAFVHYMFLSGMLIPIHALLIPIFVEFKSLGLLNGRYTLTLPYITFALLVVVLLVESSVTSIPIEIKGAVCIDGSSSLHTTSTIVMPMYRPVLSINAILTFPNTWSEFPPALVLIRSNSFKTMPIGLTNFMGGYTVNYLLMLAVPVVSTLPVVIMYLLPYNQIMKGMTTGAAKGQDRSFVLRVRQAVYSLSYICFQGGRKVLRGRFIHL